MSALGRPDRGTRCQVWVVICRSCPLEPVVRCNRAAARREAPLPARGAAGAALVEHEKERRQLGPMFASSPLNRVSAGRGHRRGLDGPTMPKQHLKIANVFLHPHRCPRGRVGRGLFRRRLRHVVGHRCPVYEGAGRGQAIDAAV